MMQSADLFLLQLSHISLTTVEQHFLLFLKCVHPEAQPALFMAQLWTRQQTAFGGAGTASYLTRVSSHRVRQSPHPPEKQTKTKTKSCPINLTRWSNISHVKWKHHVGLVNSQQKRKSTLKCYLAGLF